MSTQQGILGFCWFMKRRDGIVNICGTVYLSGVNHKMTELENTE